MNEKNIVLIKLGGSVITDKEKSMQLRADILSRLVQEIARARAKNPEQLYIVAHGQGSFAHFPAAKYGTMQGFRDDESRLGMAITLDVVTQLNRIVVKAFIDAGIPAVSVLQSNSIVTHARKVESSYIGVLEEYLQQGLLPITTGDVLVDSAQGCTIWSAEEGLTFFAEELMKHGWKIEKIAHVVEVDGFYDTQKKVVPEISNANWPELKKALTATKGIDVTGGMGLKVEESLSIAQQGVPSFIISGLKKDNLYNLLIGKSWLGTRIV